MAMRASPARWFELLTLKTDLSSGMQALAATHAVQLETHSDPSASELLPELQTVQSEYAELHRRYQSYWPAATLRGNASHDDPAKLQHAAVQRLQAWANVSESLILEIEDHKGQRTRLLRLKTLLDAAGPEVANLGGLATAGPVLSAIAYQLPLDLWPRIMPAGVLAQRITGKEHTFLVAAGLESQVGQLSQELDAMKGRRVPLPQWLTENPNKWSSLLHQRLVEIDDSLNQLQRQLDANNTRYDLSHSLGDLELMHWLSTHLAEVPCTDNFAWIVGWTSDPDIMHQALDRAGTRYLLRFPDSPPHGFDAPMLFANPSWARPFELFARLLGMPSASEADPSRFVALIVPLLFGFMFGDVGHGLVLAIIGLILRKRIPTMSILVAGGLASMVFGIAFGSFFALHTVVPALWHHPLDEPLLILTAALLLGGIIITLGLALGGLSALWLGQFNIWLATRAGLMVAYLSAWAMLIDLRSVWLIGTGLTWYVLGHFFVVPKPQRKSSVSKALIELPEDLLQLTVNTISFVRVGAFALAHAGLCTAAIELSRVPESTLAGVSILIVANVFIIVLEGLVVGIQTTRLVLFEFFIRFLRGEGRVFQPLPSPSL